jgi:hypothetical protein
MDNTMTTLAANLSDVALIAGAYDCAWNRHVIGSIRDAVNAAQREARIHGYEYPDFRKASRLVGHLRRR